MKKLEILVGPIASGKSTYCSEAAKQGAIIVNDDAIVTATHGGHYTFNPELKLLYKSVENLLIQVGLIYNLRVVIDRPNYSRAMRRRYIGLGKSFDAPVEIVMMPREDPVIHALRRYESDARGLSYADWTEVANRHESLYEEPCQGIEGFDTLRHWSIND